MINNSSNSSIQREIPTLFITILKTIAKQPSRYLTESTVENSILRRKTEIQSIIQREKGVNICQLIVDYVTEAGRFTDDAIPVSLFSANSETIIIKNSKISGEF